MTAPARDIDRQPYSPDESRVCDFLQRLTRGEIGCGDDPIGFLIASYEMRNAQHKAMLEALKIADDNFIPLAVRKVIREAIAAAEGHTP